ncbi:rna-binding domain-containing protein [Stemphylium lycopersici]|nr:rna-binding domain-containing protein [Stemphylium lycopersici]
MSYSGSFKGDEDFLLVVSGTTRYAPYLTGWQEFKDHLRKVVKEQPGWADVYSSQGQRRGEMQGWCRLRDREDADAVYKAYYRAKGMLVHVWETSRKGDGYRLMRCNCSTLFPEVPEGDHSTGRCGIDIGRVIQLGGGRTTIAGATPYMSAQSRYPYSAYPQQQSTYAPAPVYPAYALPSPPVYSTSTNGMPVNVQGGAILTEARGIFIRNLSYKCTPADLYALLLQTVGHTVDCQFMRDSRTGVFKGVATAKFASKELAQHAASTLNGREHMGMTLHVRMDTDTTVIGWTEPMVVNGSYSVSQAKRRDDLASDKVQQ